MECKTIDDLVHDLNAKLKTKFNELTVYKGKVHNYLGLNIDYSNDNCVKFMMYDFIESLLNKARDDVNGLSPWLAENNIFNVDCLLPHISGEYAGCFHIMTAHLLFGCK